MRSFISSILNGPKDKSKGIQASWLIYYGNNNIVSYMDELTPEDIRWTCRRYEDECVGKMLFPIAMVTGANDGGMQVYYSSDIAVDNIIDCLQQAVEYLETIRQRSKDN